MIYQYNPDVLVDPRSLKLASCPSAWIGLERIVKDILDSFDIGRDFAIEFGVDYGYSVSVLANYFDKVWGVDNFKGEPQTAEDTDEVQNRTKTNLKDFQNIELFKADYRDFIRDHDNVYADLTHVDIWHDFEHTYGCGIWAATHSTVTLFHDTESFSQFVKPAVERIATETGKTFFNFPYHHGLGILVKT